MKRITKYISQNELYLLGIIVVYSVVVSSQNSGFFTLENFLDVLRGSSGMIILAMGILVVLLSGGIDLSFPAVAIFGGYATARLMIATGIDNLAFAFIVSAIIGIMLGAINALVIHYFNLPTMIATLGTSSLFSGIMTTFIGTQTITVRQMPKSLTAFGGFRLFEMVGITGNTYGLSAFIIPVVIIVILTWFIIYKTMLGRGVVALGNSAEAAKRSGFNLFGLRMFVYTYVGFLAGIMGIIYVAEVNAIYGTALYGTELTYLAAVVIGGTKLTGGEGKILGTLLGVVIVRLLNSTLVFLGLTSSWNGFFTGAVLLCSVGLTSHISRLRSRRNLTFND
ncbi:MAG: ABC transporter permease [Leptolinea sp.]